MEDDLKKKKNCVKTRMTTSNKVKDDRKKMEDNLQNKMEDNLKKKWKKMEKNGRLPQKNGRQP
jgi:hypothetical protein